MSFLSHRNRRSIGMHQDAQRQGMHLSIAAIVEQAAELVTCVLGRLTPVRKSGEPIAALHHRAPGDFSSECHVVMTDGVWPRSRHGRNMSLLRSRTITLDLPYFAPGPVHDQCQSRRYEPDNDCDDCPNEP
jgi:hypothetical protein